MTSTKPETRMPIEYSDLFSRYAGRTRGWTRYYASWKKGRKHTLPVKFDPPALIGKVKYILPAIAIRDRENEKAIQVQGKRIATVPLGTMVVIQGFWFHGKKQLTSRVWTSHIRGGQISAYEHGVLYPPQGTSNGT